MLMMIYAERLDKPGGKCVEKGVFRSYIQLAQFDALARESGGCWSGDVQANAALNRYRRNLCMFCGCAVGSNHRTGCTDGVVQLETTNDAEKTDLQESQADRQDHQA